MRETVRDPHGEEYELIAERAPRVEFWVGTPRRLWNTVTRSRSWWLTVQGERYVWPLLRESFSSEPEAEDRLRDLTSRFVPASLALDHRRCAAAAADHRTPPERVGAVVHRPSGAAAHPTVGWTPASMRSRRPGQS